MTRKTEALIHIALCAIAAVLIYFIYPHHAAVGAAFTLGWSGATVLFLWRVQP
jgi:hypothetical protein